MKHDTETEVVNYTELRHETALEQSREQVTLSGRLDDVRVRELIQEDLQTHRDALEAVRPEVVSDLASVDESAAKLKHDRAFVEGAIMLALRYGQMMADANAERTPADQAVASYEKFLAPMLDHLGTSLAGEIKRAVEDGRKREVLSERGFDKATERLRASNGKWSEHFVALIAMIRKSRGMQVAEGLELGKPKKKAKPESDATSENDSGPTPPVETSPAAAATDADPPASGEVAG